jgi:hypothetical protein
MNNSVYHYLITNRAYNPSTGTYGDTIAAGGALSFLMAPVTNPSAFATVHIDTWGAALEKDLLRSRPMPPQPAVATFFFHGFIAYFFIPETLKDIAQTLLGASPAEMTDRLPIAGTKTGFMLRDKAKDGAAARLAGAGRQATPGAKGALGTMAEAVATLPPYW